jgi:hypothetical protein
MQSELSYKAVGCGKQSESPGPVRHGTNGEVRLKYSMFAP